MPPQALIRKLTKDKIHSLIAANKALELLEATPQTDGVLVRCKPGPGGIGQLAGAAEALQIICDEDSKLVRAEAKAAAEEAARAKAEAAAAAAAARG